MTTIVAIKHMMASDSKTVVGETHFNTVKLYRVGKDIVGLAGDAPAMEKFLRWHKKKTKRPEFKDGESFNALVLNESGLYHVDESLCFDPVHDDYFAIGTGATAALVAMDMGASIIEAVECAIRRDSNSGGPVQVMELPEP